MKISSAFVTLLTAVAHVKSSTQQLCEDINNGFDGCRCNFVGGCDVNGNPIGNPMVSIFSIAPENIWGFSFIKHLFPSYAHICEHGTIAILYDCNARIPLYAATEIKTGDVKRGGMTFHHNSTLDETLQAKDSDYTGSSKDVLCFEDKETGCFRNWDGSKICSYTDPSSPIERGHMIAARYATADKDRMYATFSYTNVVPQFKSLNNGAWKTAEGDIVTWGKNCQNKANEKKLLARIFVVVGVIPSTYNKNPRFYGAPGFSNFLGQSRIPKNGEYRIVLPDIMWTGACCILADNFKRVIDVKAFAVENRPGAEVKLFSSPQAMFQVLLNTASINLFPMNHECMTGRRKE